MIVDAQMKAQLYGEIRSLSARVAALEKLSAGGNAVAAAEPLPCTSGAVGEAAPPFKMEDGRRYRNQSGQIGTAFKSNGHYPWKVSWDYGITYNRDDGVCEHAPNSNIIGYADEPAAPPSRRYASGEEPKLGDIVSSVSGHREYMVERIGDNSVCNRGRIWFESIANDDLYAKDFRLIRRAAPAAPAGDGEKSQIQELTDEFRKLADMEGNEPIRCGRMHFADWHDMLQEFAAATKAKDAEIERLKLGDECNRCGNVTTDAMKPDYCVFCERDKLQADLAAANQKIVELSETALADSLTEYAAKVDSLRCERDAAIARAEAAEAELAKFEKFDAAFYFKKGGDA